MQRWDLLGIMNKSGHGAWGHAVPARATQGPASVSEEGREKKKDQQHCVETSPLPLMKVWLIF